MEHQDRIIEAFKSSGIKRILLIDDAYDPPSFDQTAVPKLADFLDGEDGKSACRECDIKEEVLESAQEAAESGDADSVQLEKVYESLYEQFWRTNDTRFDPGGHFSLFKKQPLSDLQPLCTLLGKCGDEIEVKAVGLQNGESLYHEFQPQVLFLDYYLGEDVPADGTVSSYAMAKTREASIYLLQQLIESATPETFPAIILMSSREPKKTKQYRRDVTDKLILSLRFYFLKKKSIRQDNQKICIDHAAADVLLDASQGYIFGCYLQQALVQWKNGLEAALKKFTKEISDLSTKDFAYLLRFRLREEEQPLGEYLEWFFGECLKGLIEKEVDWTHSSFSELNDNEEICEAIEGAFDGRTNMVARFFHLVKVSDKEIPNYRLGSLYTETEGSGAWVVINPDCDLVVRNDVMKAKSILTMKGTLETFDKGNSSADDFLMHEEKYYSVHWDPKNLETFSIEGEGSLEKFQFLGTFRPLYAQEIQRRVLSDLSRVGLPVAPAFGTEAPASIWIRSTEPDIPFRELKMNTPAFATILFSRAKQKGNHRVLFRRQFLNEMIDELKKVNVDDIPPKYRSSYNNLLKKDGINKLHDEYLRSGCAIRKSVYGIGFVMDNKPDQTEDKLWLQILLDISATVQDELSIVDPLDI